MQFLMVLLRFMVDCKTRAPLACVVNVNVSMACWSVTAPWGQTLRRTIIPSSSVWLRTCTAHLYQRLLLYFLYHLFWSSCRLT